jgi:hypothetical protein
MTPLTTNPFARYLALGWSVIPIKRGTKFPHADLLPEVADSEANGGTRRSWKPFQERHPTREEIAEWAQHTTNIAVVLGQLSGIIVLDLDSQTAIRAATERGLPRTATARSSKGPHLYFKHPGGRVRNYRDEAEQWDLKGDGGLVNAPPSIHPTGVVYEWELAPEDVGIAEAPRWLLDIIRAGQERDAQEHRERPANGSLFEGVAQTDEAVRRRTLYFERALSNALDTLRQAGDGSRNHTLNSTSYSMGQLIAGAELEDANPNAKVDAERLEAHIRQELAATAHQMGLATREADLTISSGLRSGKQKPRTLPDFTTASLKSTTSPSQPTLAPVKHEPNSKGPNGTSADPATEPSDLPKGKGKPEKPNEANLIIELGKIATYFHTDAQERYVHYPVGTRFETSQVNHPRSSFRLWLHRRYYEVVGEPPTSNAMSQALEHLEQTALYSGSKKKVFTRIAAVEDVVYINVGDEAGHLLRVDREGWELVQEAPVLFRTTHNAEALPVPVRGGSLDLLRPLLNVADENSWKLLVGWMIGALNPWGPYAHLALRGEQDTGKSTLLRILRMFTDPAKAEENADPKTEDDFMVTALNNHVVSYDNLSAIPGWLSDGLCRMATGAGLIRRKMYKDSEEVVIAVARPALLNGIADIITRPDLLDRTMLIALERIAPERRLTERALSRELQAIAPQVMGALLDGVVMALRHQDSVQLSRLPRMADFVTWVEAAAPAFGWEAEAFLTAYEGNIHTKEANALEMDEVAYTLVQWVDSKIGMSGQRLEFTMKSLLRELSTFEMGEGDTEGSAPRFSLEWPRSPRELSNRVERILPILRTHQVQIVKGHHTRRGVLYHISRLPDAGTTRL